MFDRLENSSNMCQTNFTPSSGFRSGQFYHLMLLGSTTVSQKKKVQVKKHSNIFP